MNRWIILTAALAALMLAVPVSAFAQEPLPACTGTNAGQVHITGLPDNLFEGRNYKFLVYTTAADDVSVSMAGVGEAPFYTGTIGWVDVLDEANSDPNLWVEVDAADPNTVITASSIHQTYPGECQEMVSKTMTHSVAPPLPVRILQNNYGTITRKNHPRTITLGEQNDVSHADGLMGLIHVRWHNWGYSTATATAIWMENMGYRFRVRITVSRLRENDNQSAMIYTRARVRVTKVYMTFPKYKVLPLKGWPRVLHLNLPTRETDS